MTNLQGSEIEINKFISIFFNSIKFFLRKNLIYIVLIIIIGVIIARVFSNYTKSYESKIIISPNYGSVDYLYNEIELINSKIKDKDEKFLNKNGISTSINAIEIKPINNIYQFVQESDKNFDLLKLFAEDGDINKVAIDEKTSKNYKTHEITINSAKNLLNTHDINKLLHYLNNNKYYNELRLIYIKNEQNRLLANENTIKQIDQVFSKLNNSNSSSETKNFVYVNDNNQLDDLLVTKQNLLKENDYIKVNELLSSNVIKKISESLNIESLSKFKLYVILFPIILLFFFISLKIIYSKK